MISNDTASDLGGVIDTFIIENGAGCQ